MKSLPELEPEIAYTTGEIAILKRLKIALEMQMEKRCQNAQLLLHGSEELKKDLKKKQEISVEVLESEVVKNCELEQRAIVCVKVLEWLYPHRAVLSKYRLG